MNNKYSVACITLVRDKYTVRLHAARCTLQFVRRCYGLRGIYGRFDSKIRFKIESDGRFDSRFDSNAKKRFAGL